MTKCQSAEENHEMKFNVPEYASKWATSIVAVVAVIKHSVLQLVFVMLELDKYTEWHKLQSLEPADNVTGILSEYPNC